MKALCLSVAMMAAMCISNAFTFNADDDRLRPSSPDRILVVSMDEHGNRLIEDHPKPVYGEVTHHLPVEMTMPIDQLKHHH